MSEVLKSTEISSKKAVSENRVKQNFQKSATKVQEIQNKEQEQALTNFLKQNQIPSSSKNKSYLKNFVKEKQLFDENFSLADFTDEDIALLKKDSFKETQKQNWQENKSEAQTAESLIDTWKADGFSNYEVLQKLLKAHQTGKVKLLPEKYQQFSQFFTLLENNSFAGDTAQIIEVINTSNVDLSSPKAFDKVVFAIFEDEQISEATKVKISQHFGLSPIVTGDDVRENLQNRQKQRQVWQEQQENLEKNLVLLTQQTNLTKNRLKQLKEEIYAEKNFEKKRALEQRYDELEELLEKLKKDTQTQTKQQQMLQSQKISSEIFIRGVEAKFENQRIVFTIPASNTTVSVPEHFDSADIAKVVNAHLVYDMLTPLGLESYLFDPSDFNGDYPTQTILDSNNDFLHKLGVSYDGLILKKSEIKDVYKLTTRLMSHNFYSANLTKKENATKQLQKLGLLADGALNSGKFVEKLLWVKQFGKLENKTSV